MRNGRVDLTRRQYLAASAGLVAAGLGGARPAFALETVRQGFQTTIWGMPTYYLLKSGLLEKQGIKFEEFAVPSGNLTMQQMVARQVDMGTYAAQSFIIGHDKGGLVAIAQIEYVGRTAQIVTRKDLNLTKVSELKGLKVANQTGSSVGNVRGADPPATSCSSARGHYSPSRSPRLCESSMSKSACPAVLATAASWPFAGMAMMAALASGSASMREIRCSSRNVHLPCSSRA